MNWATSTFKPLSEQVLGQLLSPSFYGQLGMVVLAVMAASIVGYFLKKMMPLLLQTPNHGVFQKARQVVYALRDLLFPLMLILMLGAAVQFSDSFVEHSWLIRIAQGLAVVVLFYTIITRYVSNPLVKGLCKWLLIPLATLQVFGWLDDVTTYLDSIALEAGNIRISLYGIARVIIFGGILFWLGRLSNSAGQKVIRNQQSIDVGTREVFAKLFQIIVFSVIVILLLQVMGINLTALAVFGGALGVGLGFGLQQIASNFVSGLIILLDRSVAVGDYIELEDGRAGTIRELNMRATTIETFDGKDIVVPNERFITTSFTNWTHNHQLQRYTLEFSVAYKTDLKELLGIVIETVKRHPQVLDEPEPVDAEIASFGESGINILVEFWMEGIDDGPNRVRADLMLMIWLALKQHNIEIPFPQREVKIVNTASPGVS